MKKISILLLSFFLVIINCYSQNETKPVDKVVSEVCTSLDNIADLENLSNEDITQIVRNAIDENRLEWENGLDAIPDSRRNGEDVFTHLLNHRLILDCEKFRTVDYKYDQKFSYNVDLRKLYLATKKFLTSIETETDHEALSGYFSSSIDQIKLYEELKDLKSELENYKHFSSVFIMKPDGWLGFHINIYDYKAGDENAIIMILFEDTTDLLIDEWMYKTKEEIAMERSKQEDVYIDFKNIPPPPPPPPGSKSDGNN